MQINALEYLEFTARRLGEKQAFRDESRSLTFGGLLEDSRRIGSALLPLVSKGQPVVVFAEKGVSAVRLFLGVLQAGCFYVPIDKDMPLIRIRAILDLVNAVVLLTDEKSHEFATSLGFSGRICSEREALDAAPNPDGLAARRRAVIDTDAAYVIFTSGSTGLPKGVIGTHRGLIDYIDAFTEVVAVTETDIIGNQSPLDYIAGIRDIYIPLKTGASTDLIPKGLFAQPGRLFEHLETRGVTTIFWVAPALSLCAELDAFSHLVPTALKHIVFTGSVMPCKHLRVWQDHLPGRFFMNQYGPTEITASCSFYIVPGPVEAEDVLPIGIPFRNTDILLLDEQNREAAEGEQGEICVRGTGLSPGYYRDSERTAEVFVRNPLNEVFEERIYRTGDIGRRNEAGQIEFHGRKDNQIKHMGHRVELSEIEAVAGTMADIQQCVCLYEAPRQLIYLFYTGSAESRAISLFLRERLPGFMIPRKFVRLAEMPLLFNGKADRKALREQIDG